MADITTCQQWYELNLAALRFREMNRAAGIPAVVIGLFAWRIPALLGLRVPGGMVFPEKVTLMWDEPFDEIDERREDEELAELGFRLLSSFELPEFSGDNITHLHQDEARTTYAEVVLSRAKGMSMAGITLTSHLPGPVPVKTVRAWTASPLDRPEEFPVRRVPGSVKKMYRAHRDWLDELGQQPAQTSREEFERTSAELYRVLADHYIARGLWIEARPALVKQLLRDKGLKQARRS
jgi:hypothetical protein